MNLQVACGGGYASHIDTSYIARTAGDWQNYT